MIITLEVMPTMPKKCSVDGCDRLSNSRGWCHGHYQRWVRLGDVLADRPLGRRVPVREVTGEGYVHHGYFVVPVPPELRHLVKGETSELQHRLVMAQLLSRPLAPDESVHHRNGDRLDNRAENLELWSRWQPRGQRVEDKVAYAVELLHRYAPEKLASSEHLSTS